MLTALFQETARMLCYEKNLIIQEGDEDSEYAGQVWAIFAPIGADIRKNEKARRKASRRESTHTSGTSIPWLRSRRIFNTSARCRSQHVEMNARFR
jgi:hypothetical protein